MENQHRKITGYRELSQAEIDLMNRIKEKGAEVALLINELGELQEKEFNLLCMADRGTNSNEDRATRAEQFESINKARTWRDLGMFDIQSGFMKLIRSVARPTTFC